MSLADNTLTIVLALGQDSGLAPLTEHRAKAAVPFGGNYRIIDFCLTNCLYSGLRRVLVLTQYKSQSLHTHLRDGWSIFNPELGNYITPVPPQMRTGKAFYSGSADAIQQNTYLIERHPGDFVCIMSGDHIYRMDYAAMLDQHARTGADITVACMPADQVIEKTSGCRLMLDNKDRVTSIDYVDVSGEDSGEPAESVLASMEVFVFSKDLLLKVLGKEDFNRTNGENLCKLIVSRLIRSHKVMAYRFGGEGGRVTPDRYWLNLHTLEAYYQANMDLLRHDSPLDLYQSDWSIRTYQVQSPPARTVPGVSSNEGLFVNSIVAGGSVISGGGVNHSILFNRVQVGDAATVEKSILLPGVVVEPGARLSNCIVDKEVVIPANESVGFDRAMDARRFTVTANGIVVIPKGYRFNQVA